jgi:hypothetical protein
MKVGRACARVYEPSNRQVFLRAELWPLNSPYWLKHKALLSNTEAWSGEIRVKTA